jgi:MFS family permease
VVGGLLGQLDLALPYVARAVILIPAALLGIFFMRDLGFTPAELRLSRFGEATRTVASAGLRYGWGDPVVRPLMLAGLIHGVFFMYGFYSWQVYFLDLLGEQLVWVNGVIAALVGLSGIAGAALVAPIGRRLSRQWIVWAMVLVQGVAIVLAAVLQVFWLAVPLYLVATLAFGVQQPVRQAWLNARIPSEQRATVISLDALFADAGGAGGQVGLGYLSRAVSIPAAWIVGGVIQLAALPLVAQARRAEAASPARPEPRVAPPQPDCSRPVAGHRVC